MNASQQMMPWVVVYKLNGRFYLEPFITEAQARDRALELRNADVVPSEKFPDNDVLYISAEMIWEPRS